MLERPNQVLVIDDDEAARENPTSPVHIVPPAPVVPVGAETVSLKEIGRQAALRAEREAISAMLAWTNWNKRKAAARLQISYKALLYKIKDCGLTDPRLTASLPENLGPFGVGADS
jgi:two-component system response regulator AtoC